MNKRALSVAFKYGLASALMASTFSASAIINGRSADPRIGKSAIYIFDESKESSCTGVVVHPRMILTAAHCLTNTKKENLSFSNKNTGYSYRYRLPSQSIHVTEGYLGDTNGMQSTAQSAGDIGIVLFREPILKKLGLTEADLPPIARDASSLREPLRIVGYGYESRNAQHETASRRELLVQASATTAQTMKLTSLEDKRTPCFGDSGSGVFGDDGRTTTLVGIVCSIKPGGKLAEEFRKKTAEERAKNEAKRQRIIEKNAKRGITTPVPEIPIKLSEGLMSRVCGDRDTITQAVPVARHLCWIQRTTSIALAPNLNCTGSGVAR